MQIIVTDAGRGRSRVLTLRAWHVLIVGAGLALLASVAALAAYRYLLPGATQSGWPAVMGAAVAQPDPKQRERFMRENLDAMAAKVGEMQAKLMKLDAVGARVSGLAGLKPEDFQGLDSASPAAAAPAASGARGGSGGPYLPIASPSLAQLHAELDLLDEQADRGSDIFALAESRLLEVRLRSLMVPSSAPVRGPVGSGFGFRTDPFTGRAALHSGLDFPAEPGTPIAAAAGGVVRTAELHPAYGMMVELDHGNGLVTRYAHASKLLVQVGDLVKRGQTIAKVGSTGRSTGPHLHFEVMVDGVHQNPARFLALAHEPLSTASLAPAAYAAPRR